MKKHIVLLFFVALLLGVAGCEEEKLEAIDKIAENVEIVTEVGEDVLQSPAGSFVPPDYRLFAEIGGGLALALIAGWRELRKRQSTKTLGAVVRAIETKVDKDEKAIKEQVADNLQSEGIYSEGKTLIQNAKNY